MVNEYSPVTATKSPLASPVLIKPRDSIDELRDHHNSITQGRLSQSSHLSDLDLELEDLDSNQRLLNDNSSPGDLDLLSIANQTNKSSLKMAFMNMANSILGAGIIGQPYAMRQSGFIGGTILLVLLTFVIDWTLRLMVINAKLSGTKSFQDTVRKCFGTSGRWIVAGAQGAFAFGGSVAFCIIIGDTIPHVLVALVPSLANIPVVKWLVRREGIMILVTAGISYPLALHRDIGKLAKASMLALFGMLIIVLTVLIRSPSLPSDYKGGFSTPLMTINKGFFQGVSVISFAFVCHHNTLLIYNSLKTPTLDRFATVTHLSTGVAMFACMGMALGGFFAFGDKTKGNVLNNFPASDVMANIARFCFGVNMVTTLPLEIFVCREVILDFLPHTGEGEHDLQDGSEDPPFSQFRHVVVTTILVFTALILALLTCNLGMILELVGATSACLMAYILPPLCYLKLRTEAGRKEWWMCWICILFGFTVMIISSAMTIFSSSGEGDKHCV